MVAYHLTCKLTTWEHQCLTFYFKRSNRAWLNYCSTYFISSRFFWIRCFLRLEEQQLDGELTFSVLNSGTGWIEVVIQNML